MGNLDVLLPDLLMLISVIAKTELKRDCFEKEGR
jgi:hypothetical protein